MPQPGRPQAVAQGGRSVLQTTASRTQQQASSIACKDHLAACPSAAEIAAIDDPSRPRSASPCADFFLQRNSRSSFAKGSSDERATVLRWCRRREREQRTSTLFRSDFWHNGRDCPDHHGARETPTKSSESNGGELGRYGQGSSGRRQDRGCAARGRASGRHATLVQSGNSNAGRPSSPAAPWPKHARRNTACFPVLHRPGKRGIALQTHRTAAWQAGGHDIDRGASFEKRVPPGSLARESEAKRCHQPLLRGGARIGQHRRVSRRNRPMVTATTLAWWEPRRSQWEPGFPEAYRRRIALETIVARPTARRFRRRGRRDHVAHECGLAALALRGSDGEVA